MPILGTLRRFVADEHGAATVDWVVITAGSIGLSLAVLAVVTGNTSTLSSRIDAHLSRQTLSSTITP